PDIEADKQVPAAHLPQLELREPGSPVAPGDGNDRPRKPAYDRLQGKLDREVEVRRKKRAASVDHVAPVGFKGVSHVVELNAKQQSEKKVGGAVDDILHTRVVDDAATPDEAASKDAIVTGPQLLPIAHDVTAIVGFIGHHDGHRV